MKELVKIQTELKAPKNQYNAFGKYKYRSAESILEAVKPLLKETGCFLTLSDDVVAVGERIYVKAVATLTNKDGQSVSAQAFAREEDAKGQSPAQQTGSSSSYARKYALNGLFAIDDTKDADALNTSAEYTAGTDTALLTQAVEEAKAARDRNELTDVWKRYAALQRDVTFLNVVTEKGKEFKA